MLNAKTAVLLPLMTHSLAHLNKVIITMSIFFEKTTLKFSFYAKSALPKFSNNNTVCVSRLWLNSPEKRKAYLVLLFLAELFTKRLC